MIESSREGEAALLDAAAAAGVPVPRVRWVERDPAVLGAPFFVMDFVEGETIGKRLVRDPAFEHARSELPEQIARALARIHAIDPNLPQLAFLARPGSGRSPAQEGGDPGHVRAHGRPCRALWRDLGQVRAIGLPSRRRRHGATGRERHGRGSCAMPRASNTWPSIARRASSLTG